MLLSNENDLIEIDCPFNPQNDAQKKPILINNVLRGDSVIFFIFKPFLN
jgi:hypothetical protein